jgi:hypothetical protein
MKTDPVRRGYTLRPIQKEGWNLQVGTCSAEGEILYIGKSENLLSLRRGYDLSIYHAHTSTLLVSGEQRKGVPAYLMRFVLMRNGVDVCSIQQARLLSTKLIFSFADGDECDFWSPFFRAKYRGSSPSGWSYEVVEVENEWRVSIEGKVDDLVLLSALNYCFRNSYMDQFS